MVLTAVLFTPVSDSMQAVFDLVVVAVVFPAILWVGIHCELPARYLPAASFLGDISYPVYIVHFPLLTIALFAAKRVGYVPSGLFIVLFTLAVVIFAWLLSRYYDAPVRSWLSGRLDVRRSAPPQSVAA